MDHADWNYGRLLGRLQKRRFKLILSLMKSDGYRRLLDVGYGSGVLSKHGVPAELVSSSATDLPFDDAFFECVVAVSALEFVDDIHAACSGLARVMAPGGVLMVVTPGESPLLDLALRATTGEDASRDFGDRRQALVPTLLQHFSLRDEIVFPGLLGRVVPVYRALRLAVR